MNTNRLGTPLRRLVGYSMMGSHNRVPTFLLLILAGLAAAAFASVVLLIRLAALAG